VEVRAFAASVIARETLRDVALALYRARIPVMPLKGVLFQLVLYQDPAERSLCDIDVLVPERRFSQAIAVLVQHGFRPASAGPSWIEAAFASPRGLPLDLHRRIFCSRRYRLSTRELFMRATVDDRLLGVPIWMQHPLDTLAHLVGKLISDHAYAALAPRLAELEKLIEHRHLGPELAARHLLRCGLGRAARRVFTLGAREREHPFYAAALRALPPDPMGDALVALADRLAAHGEHRAFGPLSAHLLNASLWRGATSLAMAAVYAAEHACLARAGGKPAGYWAPFLAESSSAARRRASSARSV
jgi:putative nucleotidyltransferase-like protein